MKISPKFPFLNRCAAAFRAQSDNACALLVIAWTILIATPAHAEVCDKERPNWDGSPVSLVDEAIALALGPTGLFFIGATAVAVLFRHSIGVGIACVMWAFYITALIMRGDDVFEQAVAEGCIGNPALFVGLVAAICLAAVLFTIRREKRL